MSYLTHNKVATRWLQQNTSDIHADYVAKRGHSMFYEGQTIYSYGYHYPIARWHDGKTVYLNADPSTVTTERHKRIVWWTLRQQCKDVTVFTLPPACWNGSHAASILFYRDKIETAIGKWRRARKHKNVHMRYAADYLQEFKTYCAFHNLNPVRAMKGDGAFAAACAVVALNPVPETDY